MPWKGQGRVDVTRGLLVPSAALRMPFWDHREDTSTFLPLDPKPRGEGLDSRGKVELGELVGGLQFPIGNGTSGDPGPVPLRASAVG